MRIANELEAMYGKEPDTTNIGSALNWYSFTASKDDKKNWFLDYLKEIGADFKAASLVSDSFFMTAGTIARLWMRGVHTPEFDEKLTSFKEEIMKEANRIQKETQDAAAAKAAYKEAVAAKEISESLTEINLIIDSFIQNKFVKFDYASWVRTSRPSKEAQEIIQVKMQKMLDELIASKTDPELAEGYSNFSKKEKEKFIELLEGIVSSKVTPISSVSRKPRKKKTVTPEKMVKRLKFLQEFKELKLESIDPTILVGATSLWVYNVKYRILTNYVSDSGLAVKGSTLLNINEQETKSKKLRKPEVTVPEVMTAGKVPLRKVFDSLTTGFLKTNGRINKDTILLRVVK